MASEQNEYTDIQICTLPWDQVECDAFVCPTNSEGSMSQFPASKIRDLAGPGIEEQVRPHTPLAIGAAFVSGAGRMRAHHLIHVPNTDKPGGKVQVEDVLRATAAVLVAARVKGFTTIAMPLMGAFESGIPAEEAARAIHSEFKSFRGERPLKVFLMARDANDVEVFEVAIDGGPP